MKPKRTRFWDFVDTTWVKLTIERGKMLSWFKHSITEEGYRSVYMDYEYRDDGLVYCTMVTNERDCDGRIKRCWQGIFKPGRKWYSGTYPDDWNRDVKHIYKLHATPPMKLVIEEGDRYNPKREFYTPDWQTIASGQRDYEAERAGY